MGWAFGVVMELFGNNFGRPGRSAPFLRFSRRSRLENLCSCGAGRGCFFVGLFSRSIFFSYGKDGCS